MRSAAGSTSVAKSGVGRVSEGSGARDHRGRLIAVLVAAGLLALAALLAPSIGRVEVPDEPALL